MKLYWDQAIITDHTILYNEADILVILKDEKEAKIIEIVVPPDDNLCKAGAENIEISGP